MPTNRSYYSTAACPSQSATGDAPELDGASSRGPVLGVILSVDALLRLAALVDRLRSQTVDEAGEAKCQMREVSPRTRGVGDVAAGPAGRGGAAAGDAGGPGGGRGRP